MMSEMTRPTDDELEAEKRRNENWRQIERNVQAERERQFKRAEAAEADFTDLAQKSTRLITEIEAERDALKAQLAEAVGVIVECREEIDDYIRHEYPHDHPVQERYRERDFAANPARAFLARLEGDKP